MPKTCKVCNGQYEPLQNGMKYFHACPPIPDQVTVKRGDTVATVKADAVLPTDETLLVTYVDRPDKVDENVAVKSTTTKTTTGTTGA